MERPGKSGIITAVALAAIVLAGWACTTTPRFRVWWTFRRMRKPDNVTQVERWLRAAGCATQLDAGDAIKTLADLGAPAVPWLIRALETPDIRVQAAAAGALARIGRPAVPALIAALKDKDEDVRRCAAAALGYIGPAGQDVVRALISAQADQDEAVRDAATEALKKIRPAPKEE